MVFPSDLLTIRQQIFCVIATKLNFHKNLRITNQLLYLLSYTSKYTTFRREVYFNTRKAFRQYKPELFLFLQKYTNSIQDFFLAKKSTAFSNFTYYSTFFPSMFF